MKPTFVSTTFDAASAGAHRRRSGFTLIELLTVIAIISLLAAILLPVFGAVRENARRAACMSNMREISAAVKQYELDNRKYPDYLLGPALNAADGTVKTTTGNDAMNLQQVSGYLATINPSGNTTVQNAKDAYANSLYPTYIKDLNIYHCPNNSDYDQVQTTDAVAVKRFEKGDNVTPTVTRDLSFYRYDSYDANPALQLNGSKFEIKPASNNYAARYSRLWQPLLKRPELQALAGSDIDRYNSFRRQLVFNNPSSDTYLTMCTNHVPRGKVIVLWLNGTAKVIDTQKLNDPKFAGTNGRDVDANVLTPNNY